MPVLLVLALAFLSTPGCAVRPVAGPVTAGFAPTSLFAGHWGVDFAVEPGTVVRAAGAGRVSFAGVVVDNRSVTVRHGGDVRTSYSFLAAIHVEVGDLLVAGSPVGLSGMAHGTPALHFSLRVGDRYLDPAGFLACGHGPSSGLHLVSESGHRRLYAVRRATRHPGRNLRPPAHCASDGGRSRAANARAGRHHVYHRR